MMQKSTEVRLPLINWAGVFFLSVSLCCQVQGNPQSASDAATFPQHLGLLFADIDLPAGRGGLYEVLSAVEEAYLSQRQETGRISFEIDGDYGETEYTYSFRNADLGTILTALANVTGGQFSVREDQRVLIESPNSASRPLSGHRLYCRSIVVPSSFVSLANASGNRPSGKVADLKQWFEERGVFFVHENEGAWLFPEEGTLILQAGDLEELSYMADLVELTMRGVVTHGRRPKTEGQEPARDGWGTGDDLRPAAALEFLTAEIGSIAFDEATFEQALIQLIRAVEAKNPAQPTLSFLLVNAPKDKWANPVTASFKDSSILVPLVALPYLSGSDARCSVLKNMIIWDFSRKRTYDGESWHIEPVPLLFPEAVKYLQEKGVGNIPVVNPGPRSGRNLTSWFKARGVYFLPECEAFLGASYKGFFLEARNVEGERDLMRTLIELTARGTEVSQMPERMRSDITGEDCFIVDGASREVYREWFLNRLLSDRRSIQDLK